MKTALLVLTISIVLFSCAPQGRCYPSKRSKDYAETQIKEGIITKNHEKTILVSVNRTMKGFKHLFVTERNDTIARYFNCPLSVGDCYYVLKDFNG